MMNPIKIKKTITFVSPLAPYFQQLISEKQSLGYKFRAGVELLRSLDAFIAEHKVREAHLPKDLMLKWIAKKPREQEGTRLLRVYIVRQAGEFLRRHGMSAYVPEAKFAYPDCTQYVPYIFPAEEIQRIFHALDHLSPWPQSPHRQRVMPAIFRMLYGCGLRLNEALHLKTGAVDLDNGVLTIIEGKFRRDRLTPMTKTLTQHLRDYAAATLDASDLDVYFFPAPDNGPYSHETVYYTFRKMLERAGIPHRGRGAGPRLHDLRHTFAVHCLQRWVRKGVALNAALPILATYMGHTKLRGTQRYLRLTAELYPDLVNAVENKFGSVIPERIPS